MYNSFELTQRGEVRVQSGLKPIVGLAQTLPRHSRPCIGGGRDASSAGVAARHIPLLWHAAAGHARRPSPCAPAGSWRSVKGARSEGEHA